MEAEESRLAEFRKRRSSLITKSSFLLALLFAGSTILTIVLPDSDSFGKGIALLVIGFPVFIVCLIVMIISGTKYLTTHLADRAIKNGSSEYATRVSSSKFIGFLTSSIFLFIWISFFTITNLSYLSPYQLITQSPILILFIFTSYMTYASIRPRKTTQSPPIKPTQAAVVAPAEPVSPLPQIVDNDEHLSASLSKGISFAVITSLALLIAVIPQVYIKETDIFTVRAIIGELLSLILIIISTLLSLVLINDKSTPSTRVPNIYLFCEIIFVFLSFSVSLALMGLIPLFLGASITTTAFIRLNNQYKGVVSTKKQAIPHMVVSMLLILVSVMLFFSFSEIGFFNISQRNAMNIQFDGSYVPTQTSNYSQGNTFQEVSSTYNYEPGDWVQKTIDQKDFPDVPFIYPEYTKTAKVRSGWTQLYEYDLYFEPSKSSQLYLAIEDSATSRQEKLLTTVDLIKTETILVSGLTATKRTYGTLSEDTSKGYEVEIVAPLTNSVSLYISFIVSDPTGLKLTCSTNDCTSRVVADFDTFVKSVSITKR